MPNPTFRTSSPLHHLRFFRVQPQVRWGDTDVKEDFGDALDRKIISDDSIPKPLWKSRKLIPLKGALEQLKLFLDSSDGQAFAAETDANVPMEPDDVEFWERHLHLW